MLEQNIETLARAEVEAKNLEREIAPSRPTWRREEDDDVAAGQGQERRLPADRPLRRHRRRAQAQLANRLDHYNATAGILKEKQDTLKAKQMTIDAAHGQLDNIQEQRSTLTARLANIEAKLKMLEATQAKNEFNFDDSALSRAKKTVSELEQRLDIMARKAEIEGRFGNVDGTATYVDPARDVVKEVDEAFGPVLRTEVGRQDL